VAIINFFLLSISMASCEDLDEYTWKEFPRAQFFYDDVIIAEVR